MAIVGSTAAAAVAAAARSTSAAIDSRTRTAFGVCPRRKRTRSPRISSAFGYRSSTRFAIADSTIASKPAGTVGSSELGGAGSSFTCLYAMETGVSPVKGGLPVAISYSTTPRE
jgi:hypothetical protein